MSTLAYYFVNILVITIGGMLLVTRLMDSRERRQVAMVLKSEEPVAPKHTVVNLLRDLKASGEAASTGLLSALNLTRKLEEQLQLADLAWPVARLTRLMAIMALAGMACGVMCPFLGGPVLTALAMGATCGYLPCMYVNKLARKRLDRMETQLPDAMDFLARSMRGGHAFTISIGMVGSDLPDPLGREFRTLFNEQNMGASLETAFAGFIRRVPLQDAKLFCSAATLSRRTGGNLAEILGRLSELVRERFRLRGQVKAASAHGRMTAGILMALPLLTLVGMLSIAPSYLLAMWNDPDGKLMMFGALVALLFGNFVIRKIVRIKV